MSEKISIIVPIYKVENYLRRAIRSILNQTYDNLEIILVEDGSPDNCGKICDSFEREDSRIKVIHQANAGVCAARNAALDVATGDYLGFVDPDDYIDPDMFEYLLSNLKKYDADIACCRFARVDIEEEINVVTDGETHIYDDSKDAIRELLKIKTIKAVFWNKLFKREIFDGVRFPEGVIYEGTLMVHQLFMKSQRTVFLPEAKYYYVECPDSYVHTKSLKYQCNYVNAHITRYQELYDVVPDQRERMLKKILQEITILTKTAYINPEDIASCIDDIKLFAKFLNENEDAINALSGKGRLVEYDLQYIKAPTEANLKKAFKMHARLDKEKGKKITRILQESKERQLANLPPVKQRININDLTEEDKLLFKKLHDAEQELLDELARICDAHGLSYFLYGGTLLGAVRHKGFIPWDDDIDIAMPRKDYDAFAELCKIELDPKYHYQCHALEPEYPLLFGKLRKNNTLVTEFKFKDKNIHQGIYIDIMPLDYFPEVSDTKRRALMADFNVMDSASQREVINTRYFFNRWKFRYYKSRPKNIVLDRREDFVRNVAEGKETNLVCSFGSHYKPMYRRIFPAEWFVDNGTKMEFEGKMYTVPAGWKEYLLHLFGESYMEWPPMKERVNHFNVYDVDFGD